MDDSLEQRQVSELLTGKGSVVGVDVGGNGTRSIVVSDGRFYRSQSSMSYNFLLNDANVMNLSNLVDKSGAQLAGFGIPGIGRVPGAAHSLASEIAKITGVSTVVESDATIAWLGAFLGDPGIVVIAGTGSVALGGRTAPLARVGGYGYLIGDDGGGYWIGRRALHAALAAVDGSGPTTILVDALPESTGLSLDELVVRVHREPSNRSLLSQFAVVVSRCVGNSGGDEVCQMILEFTATSLANLALTLSEQVGDLPVAGVGGVFNEPVVLRRFATLTGAVSPRSTPEVGATLLVTERWPTEAG